MGILGVELCPSERRITSPHPVPMNVTSFGSRVIAEVLKFSPGHPGAGWVLNPITGVPIRRGRLDRNMGTHIGKKAEAKMEMMQ